MIAAWPPGVADHRKRLGSGVQISGNKPVVVCNQTGHNNGMNCLVAQSAIILDVEMEFAYNGNPAVVVCEFGQSEGLALKQSLVLEMKEEAYD